MRKLRRYFAGLSCGLLAVMVLCINYTGIAPTEVRIIEPQTIVSSEVEAVDVPYRLTEGSIAGIHEFINAQRADIPETELLEAMNEASIIKEKPEPVFPFETTKLGEKKVIANNDRDNRVGSKNFDGMTVTINPQVVPYGGIVYIEKLGFRYNQPSDVSPDENSIYLYFSSEENANKWNDSELEVYLVHNDTHLDLESGDIIKSVLKGNFHLTAYCPCVICCEEWAEDPEGKVGAKETNVYQGTTIAADPKVLPYGSVVYIEGVGIRFVADCGAAIKGRDIDVYFTDHNAAWDFGTKYRNVWILQ